MEVPEWFDDKEREMRVRERIGKISERKRLCNEKKRKIEALFGDIADLVKVLSSRNGQSMEISRVDHIESADKEEDSREKDQKTDSDFIENLFEEEE